MDLGKGATGRGERRESSAAEAKKGQRFVYLVKDLLSWLPPDHLRRETPSCDEAKRPIIAGVSEVSSGHVLVDAQYYF
jgi:hypothetical protein